MSDFSCKGCINRCVGCHSFCETYKKEKAIYDERKAVENEEIKKESLVVSAKVAAVIKTNRMSKRRKR